MWKRLFPTRWARIVSWTAAAMAWATTAVVVQQAPTEASSATPAGEQEQTPASVVTTVSSALPTLPDDGLVILRYTPVAPPEPEEIVRTVVVSRQAPASQPVTVASSGS